MIHGGCLKFLKRSASGKKIVFFLSKNCCFFLSPISSSLMVSPLSCWTSAWKSSQPCNLWVWSWTEGETFPDEFWYISSKIDLGNTHVIFVIPHLISFSFLLQRGNIISFVMSFSDTIYFLTWLESSETFRLDRYCKIDLWPQ